MSSCEQWMTTSRTQKLFGTPTILLARADEHDLRLGARRHLLDNDVWSMSITDREEPSSFDT
jgi:hypothetical protein